MTTNLIQRCAVFGWLLRPLGSGYELLGNGAPAVFGSAESVDVWLAHQERGRKPERDDGDGDGDYVQAALELELV